MILNKKKIAFFLFVILILSFLVYSPKRLFLEAYKRLAPYHYYAHEFGLDQLIPKLEAYTFFGRLPALQYRSKEPFSFEFNGEEVSEKKPEKEYRIFVVGGANAYGKGVVDISKRFYRVFEDQLNKNSKNVQYRVYSAGTDDYNSGQVLLQFQFGIHDFKPDMVIFYESFNDFFNKGKLPGYPRHVLDYLDFLKVIQAIDSKNIGYLNKGGERIKKSDYIQDLNHLFKTNNSKTFWEKVVNKSFFTGKAMPSFYYNILRIYRSKLDAFFKICRERGIKTFFVLPPILANKVLLAGSEKELVPVFECRLLSRGMLGYDFSLKQDRQSFLSLEKKFLRDYFLVGQEVAHLNNVPVLDYSDFFKTNKNVIFTDFTNINENAQALLGKHFASSFFKKILKRDD